MLTLQRNRCLAAVLIAVALAACGRQSPAPDTTPTHDDATPADAQQDVASAADTIGAQPLPLRLAFMAGHVEAGLALYRAGEPQMAARHLLHPVSESYAEERAGLDGLGFDPDLFSTVTAALEQGAPAAAVESQLLAAEAHLRSLADRAGGAPADVIVFLMDAVIDEYSAGVLAGEVTDAAEYQDAFGFAIVARRYADKLPLAQRAAVIEGLDALRGAWPDAPIPMVSVTSVAEVTSRAQRVRLLLTSPAVD